MTEERKRIIELLEEVIDLKKQLLGTGKLRAKLASAHAVGVGLIADNERLRAALATLRSGVDRIAQGKQDEVRNDLTAGYADGCTAISYYIEEIVTTALATPARAESEGK